MAYIEPLVISTWVNAIGDSPNVGNGLIKNASIDAVPGALMPNYATLLNSFPINQTSTGTFSGGVFTLNSPTTALQTDGIAVTFATTGTLPTNITAGTVYFLYKNATNQVIVADSLAHAISHSPLAIVGNGTGTITVTSVDMGTPKSLAQDPAGVVYVADSNGRVWFSEGSQTYLLFGNTITNGSGTGVSTFKVSDGSATYLFVYRNAVIDVCNVTTQARRQDPVGTSSWSSSWQNMTQGSGYAGTHQAILGFDNITYACDNRYVNSIQEVAGKVFAPGDTTTFIFTQRALTLPGNDTAGYLEQLGLLLLVGGNGTNLIYPWDRLSPSFNLPLICPEVGVYGMKNIGNTVYVLNGLRGNIYKTTGYSVDLHRKLPEFLLQSTAGGANLVTWGGVASKNGAFMFGVLPLNTANAGTYLCYPDGRLIQENTPSQGAALPTVFNNSTGEFYYTGYAGYLDYIDTSRYSTLGSVVFQSELYNVGTQIGKAHYDFLEVQLDQPGAVAGQVRISYRLSASGAFTTLATFTLDGTNNSFSQDVGLIDIQNIQIQVELSTAGTGTNATRVIEVRLLKGSH